MSKRAKRTYYKRGDCLFLSGEANPVCIVRAISEADTGRYDENKRWKKDWLYQVRDAKGRLMRVWLRGEP